LESKEEKERINVGGSMSTDSGTAEKSNETKLPNQTTTGILNIFNISLLKLSLKNFI